MKDILFNGIKNCHLLLHKAPWVVPCLCLLLTPNPLCPAASSTRATSRFRRVPCFLGPSAHHILPERLFPPPYPFAPGKKLLFIFKIQPQRLLCEAFSQPLPQLSRLLFSLSTHSPSTVSYHCPYCSPSLIHLSPFSALTVPWWKKQ